MPAVSKKQQQLAGLALRHPEKVQNKSILGMSKTSLRHLAETKQKGLPEKKKGKKRGR